MRVPPPDMEKPKIGYEQVRRAPRSGSPGSSSAEGSRKSTRPLACAAAHRLLPDFEAATVQQVP